MRYYACGILKLYPRIVNPIYSQNKLISSTYCSVGKIKAGWLNVAVYVPNFDGVSAAPLRSEKKKYKWPRNDQPSKIYLFLSFALANNIL